ncbi:cytochrome c oxidase subunit II [Pleionea sp. CnH1-48]|uniref:cytochrome c oxidase subunit II n=1 Tax=Pleionea sp. CnH1-48 TaxID=2954494 RepID=UPI00209697B8|nr:cytochrome c oxidase subunit II [Pleionea sp. CnH1-48]MCO7224641.1 cytochrome c oxidase subunit II [Pleionea sp. CnH1-48]
MSLLRKVRSGVVLLAVLLSSSLMANPEYSIYNLRPGVTETSQEVFDLHMLVVYIMTVVTILVFGAMLYSIIRFRKSKHPVPAKFHHSTKLEIIWTVIPAIILIYLAVPAGKLLLKVEDTSYSDMTIKVTGSQWKWHYDYMDNDVSFYSSLSTPREQFEDYSRTGTEKGENYLLEVDNEVVLPIGKKVRILLTADDVIHSWWMPDFAVKMDAIPGLINETWTKIDKPGVYRGVCAELCGKDHGYMPIVVRAVSQDDFDKWVGQKHAEKAEADRLAAEAAAKSWSMEDLMADGEKVYMEKCAVCHQANGEGLATFPALKGSKVTTVDSPDDHARQVIFGKNAMPPFGDMLTDAEIAAVVTYTRNQWGNNTGQLVQPGRIKELKAGK